MDPVNTLPPPGDPFPQGSLAAAFEPVFAATLPDPAAARAAWRDCGGALLYEVEPQIYPPALADTFSVRGQARVRAVLAVKSDTSLEELTYTALDGLYPPEELRSRSLTAVHKAVHVGSPLSDDIAIQPLPVAAALEFPQNPNEGLLQGAPHAGAVAGVPAIVVPGMLDLTATRQIVQRVQAERGSIILDLRNAGASLDVVAQVADYFVGSQTLLFEVRWRGKRTQNFYAEGDVLPLTSKPVLVLIDERTAPGGLILATALADAGRADIAGTAKVQYLQAQDDVRTLYPWDGCRSTAAQRWLHDEFQTLHGRLPRYYVEFPAGVVLRKNGEPLSHGLPIKYPVDANDAAALEAVVARWLDTL
jgi:hypothetical protein